MKRRQGKGFIFLLLLFLGSFLFSSSMALYTFAMQEKEKALFRELSASVRAEANDELNGESNDGLNYMSLYQQNADFFGWLRIGGTSLDYPVMYSPSRPQYYLRHAFDGSYSESGVPFIDERCPKEGNYYLIYGHHMKNKTMFSELPQYESQIYCQKHPIISFDTLTEKGEYRVIAAFYSRIYDDEQKDVFRYYDYTDLSDEAVFKHYMAQVKAAAIYDTGASADFGDKLLVLSTCSYHIEDGRFVVVAKRVLS